MMSAWSSRCAPVARRLGTLRKNPEAESQLIAAPRRRRWLLNIVLAAFVIPAHADLVVIDFERAEIGQRLTEWVEKEVTFKLSRSPAKTKAAGRMVFFPHLGSGRKGILNAMAMEPIPVEVRFPGGASSVTLVLWGSTGCAALVEAFDEHGAVVDRAALPAAPRRASPGDPEPLFELTVRAAGIAFVRFSGPREGEFLAADEVRFTPSGERPPAGNH
jgi:hypothetical protein